MGVDREKALFFEKHTPFTIFLKHESIQSSINKIQPLNFASSKRDSNTIFLGHKNEQILTHFQITRQKVI